MAPPAEHKTWAGILRMRICDDAQVHNYWDDDKRYNIAVFSGRIDDAFFASTVGLMDTEQRNQQGVPIATEILIERRGSGEWLGNIVSTIAFYAIKDGWKIAPGTIFEQILEIFQPHTSLPHVIFVPIFQWDDLSQIELETRHIFPLLAVPISEQESQLVKAQGVHALESQWEAQGTDVCNWSRTIAV